MRRALNTTIAAALLCAGLLGCNSRTDRTDTGGVFLTVSQFDGLPNVVSVAASGGLVTIGTTTLRSIIENSSFPTSDLQTIEIHSYEVTYARGDAGTRVPSPLVETQFLSVPPGGTAPITNLAILRSAQLANPPLSDLANFGRDTETGSVVIFLRFNLRFFGTTVSGRNVVSDFKTFSAEIRP